MSSIYRSGIWFAKGYMELGCLLLQMMMLNLLTDDVINGSTINNDVINVKKGENLSFLFLSSKIYTPNKVHQIGLRKSGEKLYRA